MKKTTIWNKTQCFLGIHEWTCKAGQGTPPTKEQLESGLEGFIEYAEMYCSHCGKVSDISNNINV